MKILCTIGPNVNNTKILGELIEAGMNVLRFNFSHIDYDFTKFLIHHCRKEYKDIIILQDLQGNKLRISNLFKGEIKVFPMDKVCFCSEEIYKNLSRTKNNEYIFVPLILNGDFSFLNSANRILMKDATMEFKIIENGHGVIKTIVKRGGILRAEKGVNAPGMNRNDMGLTDKDKKDIIWGLENGVDIICLSYVCYPWNMIELKQYIKEYKKHKNIKMPKLWAKVESLEGIKNFKEILKESDGILLGRGDLISEVDILDIPKIQEDLINIMKKSKKDFIVGTYILDSMKRKNIPTLSEVNDIYRFIKNKVDGFMLAGEVSIGKNPILAVETLKNIIDKYST
ncbi:pyruvate kinase [Clostridium tetanomorphum]|uniref:Pyruvate kinase n=1 Tax=Clostridium tetanomorphum TaxID=1553 RepID=A0A923E9C0_CLOTT|nr:pyruvate kinase [Clostridium tetanomorphum]KAJ52621.1 pyruvate kinase, barrel domain [Clostridium tetanomorphum DSM 665]MBC2396824.1 pyruvate kinase [Clostridium tetanomorphum]MBP1863214.1 pyruvate kinase [Clostridium tetanomorphum]NRS84322.1 pyruvate kinase [Clostridium tetanomorphum]NRZ97536.1 pyruvate kinase [Clostridium tetanomorphum]